jgi:transposase-like protein
MRIITQLERTLSATDPVQALRELRALRAELDAFERERVRTALQSGASFAGVARGLGITRQAAHRRYRYLTAEQPRLVATPEALAILQLARHQAARLGSRTVEAEHVALALAAPTTRPRAARHPRRSDRRSSRRWRGSAHRSASTSSVAPRRSIRGRKPC